MWNLQIHVLLVFLWSATKVPVGSGAHSQLWGYDNSDSLDILGPNKWSLMTNSMCSGWRQSPVDINTKIVVRSSSLPSIMLENIVTSASTNSSFTLKNDGHKVSIYFNDDGWKANFLNSDTCISMHHVHWHWGRNDSVGSEHTVNGMSYPMEAHIVSWNCQMYKDIYKARYGPEGLYVFGIFYKVVPESEGKTSIMEDLSKVFSQPLLLKKPDPLGPNPNTSFPSFDLSKLFPKNMDKYYRYQGSLTTPDCFENVIWTVFSEPLGITQSQLNRFRSIQFGAPLNASMVDNFRPVMPLNTGRADSVHRLVFSSFSGASSPYKVTSAATICLLVSLLRELISVF